MDDPPFNPQAALLLRDGVVLTLGGLTNNNLSAVQECIYLAMGDVTNNVWASGFHCDSGVPWFIVRNATEANAARQLLNHHRPSECSNVVHIGWNGPPYQAFVGGEYKAVETLTVDYARKNHDSLTTAAPASPPPPSPHQPPAPPPRTIIIQNHTPVFSNLAQQLAALQLKTTEIESWEPSDSVQARVRQLEDERLAERLGKVEQKVDWSVSSLYLDGKKMKVKDTVIGLMKRVGEKEQEVEQGQKELTDLRLRFERNERETAGRMQQYEKQMAEMKEMMGALVIGSSGPSYGNRASTLASSSRASLSGGSFQQPPVSTSSKRPYTALPLPLTGANAEAAHVDKRQRNTGQLLDDFWWDGLCNPELRDLSGRLVNVATDKYGSGYLQRKLDVASMEDKGVVLTEFLPHVFRLATHGCGNYVVQKLFEQVSQAQKIEMATVLETHILELSFDVYGAWVVQEALKYILLEQQLCFARELDGSIIQCARDPQAHHVLQCIFQNIPPQYLQFIIDPCVNPVLALAMNKEGSSLLQCIFSHSPPHQTRALVAKVLENLPAIIQHEFGHYLVNTVVQKYSVDASSVISKLSGQVVLLAENKFASVVVERCFELGTVEERHGMFEELLHRGSDGHAAIRTTLFHQYANYVSQKALLLSAGPQRTALFDEADREYQERNRISYGSVPWLHKLLSSERQRRRQ